MSENFCLDAKVLKSNLSDDIERLYAMYTTTLYSPNLLDAGAEGSPLTAMAASSGGLMLICLRVEGLNLM